MDVQEENDVTPTSSGALTTTTNAIQEFCDDWSFGDCDDSEFDPWSAFVDAMARRFRHLQSERRLINQSQYEIESDERRAIEVFVGLSGALDFTAVVKMKDVDAFYTISLTHWEWHEFSSCLKLLLEKWNFSDIDVDGDAEEAEEKHIDLKLFDDDGSCDNALFIRLLNDDDNNSCLSVTRYGVTINLDRDVVYKLVQRNDMITYRLDMLCQLNFYEYFKKILNLVGRISNDTLLDKDKCYNEILAILRNIPNSENMYCLIECLFYMQHHVYSYLVSVINKDA